MSDLLALPHPPEIAEALWRPLAIDDAAAIHDLVRALGMENGLSGWASVEDYARTFDDPATDPARDTMALFASTGQLLALGWVIADTDTPDDLRLDLWIDVHPDRDDGRLADFLLDWLQARARQICAQSPDYAHCWINVPTEWSQTDRVRRYEEAGFTRRHSEQFMRRDLADNLPDQSMPDSVSLAAWTPDTDELMRQAFNAAFSDRLGTRQISPENWQRYYTGSSGFAGQLSFIALHQNEGIGVLRTVIGHAREAEIAHVAVHPQWRRQGIARGLMAAAMQGCRDRGMTSCRLSVDVHNEPAILTYEALGFTTSGGYTSYSKTLRREKHGSKQRFSRRDFALLLAMGGAGTLLWLATRQNPDDLTVGITPTARQSPQPEPSGTHAATSTTTAPTPDTVPRPVIVARADWGALPPDTQAENENGLYSLDNPEGWQVYADLQAAYTTAVIHHSGSPAPDDLQALLYIQERHREDRGWADIAYHFLIGRTGTLYEGRALNVRGVHVEGYNTGSVGICLLGDLRLETPTPNQLQAALVLLRWLKPQLQLTHLAGHYEFNPDTVCPGTNMIEHLDTLAGRAGLNHGTDGYRPSEYQIMQTATAHAAE